MNARAPQSRSLSHRTAIFSKLVRDYARDDVVAVTRHTSLSETIARMVETGRSSAVVTDDDRRPLGILTERDIAHRVVFRAAPEQSVADVMTEGVMTIAADDYLYYAVARMRRNRLRHMPVVDDGGVLVGMLNLADAIAEASAPLMAEIDTLSWEGSIDGLAQIKAAQVDLADHLMGESLPAVDIQALLSHINNDIYRRVVDRAVAAMESDGLGPPPVNFCVIVMGSGGRSENYIYPDQDNGFILEDYADERHGEIDGWFIEMAQRMTHDLDKIGFPLCKGFVMASNPLWRKSISQWIEQIGIWSRKRNTATLRLCDIFFDFRSVWGDGAMAKRLRDHVTAVAGGNVAFLRELYADDGDHGVALGWFGRFITEHEIEAHRGEMNLKLTGTLPLVEAIRLLSLRESVTRLSTLGRMAALFDAGVLGPDEHDYLAGAYRHITHLLLRQQIADFKAGLEVSNYVHPDSLSQREKDILTDSFKAIRSLRERLKAELTGDIF